MTARSSVELGARTTLDSAPCVGAGTAIPASPAYSGVLFPELEGHWYATYRADPVASALYRRHYSAAKNPASRVNRGQSDNFLGPGETLVLITAACDAVFAWQRNTGPRLDKQTGVICTLFRNEGAVLSSSLIREACEIAWRRWPGWRLFTYVSPSQIRSVNPGACFKHAGWQLVRDEQGAPYRSGRGLLLLEILPPPHSAVLPAERLDADRPATDISHEGGPAPDVVLASLPDTRRPRVGQAPSTPTK